MLSASRLAAVGSLLGDSTRATILSLLADGRPRSVTALAAAADVSASTASLHLAKLVDAGLLEVRQQGRVRRYHLANPALGDLLHAVAHAGGDAPATAAPSAPDPRHVARTCYDHLAGRLGVRLARSLADQGVLVDLDADNGAEPTLTETGVEFLERVEVRIPQGRRPLIRTCPDWSESQPHLSGRLGAALLQRALKAEWVRRTPGRAVEITDAGRLALRRDFDVSI